MNIFTYSFHHQFNIATATIVRKVFNNDKFPAPINNYQKALPMMGTSTTNIL